MTQCLIDHCTYMRDPFMTHVTQSVGHFADGSPNGSDLVTRAKYLCLFEISGNESMGHEEC